MMPMFWTFAHDRPVLHVPVATVPEPQQGWPRAPQAGDAAGPAPGSTQAKRVEQVAPPPAPLGQQGWPEPPHAAQVMPPSAPAVHAPPLWQMLPGQQAVPTAPQFMQTLG